MHHFCTYFDRNYLAQGLTLCRSLTDHAGPFTLWVLYLVNHYPQIERITYLDADLLFYAPPSTIFEELGDRSILIVGHRFPERLRHLESQFGIYNVGLLAFLHNPPGKRSLP